MKKILFVLIAFSCLSCKYDPLHMNQPAAQTFEKAVEQQDRLLNLEVNAVAPSNDGGYVVVGRKENQEGGEFGFWIKTVACWHVVKHLE